MGILDTVKKGFSLMVSSLSIVAIFFAYGAVTNFINVQFTSKVQTDPATASNPLMALSIALSLLSVFLGLYLQAGSMGYFKEKLQAGKSGLPTFFASGTRYFLPLLIFGLIIMGIVAVASVGSIVMVRTLPRPVAILGSIVLAAAALTFVVAWFLAPYAIVVNGKSVPAAMKESVALVKQNLVKIVLIGLILIAIGFLVGFVFGLITGVGGAVLNRQNQGAVPQGVIALMSSVVNAFLGVLMTTTFMHFYLKTTGQEHASAA
jgi:hypothetical protein